METPGVGPKLQQLENFLTKPDSEESKNYINDMITKETARPEDLFVHKFLNYDFWREMGFSDKETKIEDTAGTKGRVEIAFHIEGQKIAVECKRPYLLKKGEAVINELDGNDILELKTQISDYLISHSFVVFTNGFHWFFYSRESYSLWLRNKDKKNNQLKPYFDHITGEQIFDTLSPKYILNILTRNNILDSLSEMGDKSVRSSLTDEFFQDLKSWVNFIDYVLKDTRADEKARTTTLINKLIFVRTMEGVGIIPNGFLATLWDNKKGVKNSTVDFIDHIDDELSQIYDTELFTSKYILDENGEPVLKDGIAQYSKERQRNYAYKALPEDFFSAILKPITALTLDEYGKSRIRFNDKEFYLRSLYWWRFESIPADILGKAYETYLARERKKHGIYYTPHEITEYIASNTVTAVFDKKISLLKSLLDKNDWDKNQIKSIANKIREIKICDPSCGSGSFLIQAMRIIWKKYKELECLVKNYDEKLTKGSTSLDKFLDEKAGLIRYLEVLFRTRDNQERIGTIIVRHLFGNDKDVKAIDTAKLNIWLECFRLDPNSYRREKLKDKQHVLPNLELNLTVGDSLVGLTPLDADKELSHMKDTIKSIFSLREKYTESFDKTSIAKAAIPLRDGLQGFVNHEFAEKYGTKATTNLLKILEPIHWSLSHFVAFYDSEGNLKQEDDMGFDVIIGNPPWEKLKIQDREFFAARDPKIANATTAAMRKKLIKDIEKTNPGLFKEYQEARKNAEQLTEYLKKSGKYPLGSVGDVNLYPIFLELSRNLLKKDGLCGMVVKTGILTDASYQKFFEDLVFTSSLDACHDFTNKQQIFEDVIENERFSLLLLKNSNTEDSKFQISVLNESMDELLAGDKIYFLNKNEIKLFNPNTKTCPLFHSKKDYQMCKEIYEKNPILIQEQGKNEINPWNFEYWRMYDMTNDSDLFHQKESLIKDGFKLEKNCWFVKNSEKYIPLYEAKFFSNYNHRHGSFENVPVETRFGVKAEPYHPNDEEMNDPNYEVEPRYWVPLDGVLDLCNKKKVPNDCFFSFRNVCRTFTDSRTARGTIIPFSGVGNSAPILIFRNEDDKLRIKNLTLFSCVFSSFVFDYLVRQKLSGANLNKYILIQIAAPEPKTFDQIKLEFNGSKKTAANWCLEKALSVFPVSHSLFNFFKNLGASKPVEWKPSDRINLSCFIDAVVAHVYGVKKENYEYILNQFPILRRQEEEKFGKFLSLEKCLEYFDSLKRVTN